MSKEACAELVAPAGSFAAGIKALEGGADAVYTGLSRFSARAGARNPDFAELDRLIMFAHSRDKKVYVALNTVIKDNELEELGRFLARLVWLRPDGVIIQDAGMLRLGRTLFRGLPLHASTQMAVHNFPGALHLWQAGVKRVVVAREMSPGEIRRIRTRLPELELEVFIHGALCYSVSGLCLASGRLLGRSGNRGECAQICRTWFSREGENGYFFSCRDLALEEEINKLCELGVRGLKIEGRMKDPVYASLASAYYRSLLDGGDPHRRREILDQLKISFARPYTRAFFTYPPGEKILNKEYPSRMGVAAGEILAAGKRFLDVKLDAPMQVRDGLLFFIPGSPPRPVKFGVHRIEKGRKSLFSAEAGDRIRLFVNQPFPALPEPGTRLRRISAADRHSASPGTASYPPGTYPLRGDLLLDPSGLCFRMSPASLRDLPGWRDAADSEYCHTASCSPEPARGDRNFEEVVEQLFAQKGAARFEISELKFHNSFSPGNSAVFLPPRFLKAFKNSVYSGLEGWLQAAEEKLVARVAGPDPAPGCGMPDGIAGLGGFTRSACVYGPWSLPFAHSLPDPAQLPRCGDWAILALPPLLFESEAYFKRLRAYLEGIADLKVLVGLNNPAHLAWVEALAAFPELGFFIDYGLYCANRQAYYYYLETIPRLVFVLFWVEGEEALFRELARAVRSHQVPLLACDGGFHPPLFSSRVCYRSQSLGLDCRDCGRSHQYFLRQNHRRYRMVVQDCMSYLLPAD